MDIFQTTITSLQLLYTFVDSCVDFSADAKSLSIRLRRDVRILEAVQNHLVTRQNLDASEAMKYNSEDEQLLSDITSYLETLLSRARAIESKIGANSSTWRKTTKQLTWFHYQRKIAALQRELHEWTDSFDLRILTLPQEVRMISAIENPKPEVLETQEMIRRVLERSDSNMAKLNSRMLMPSLVGRIQSQPRAPKTFRTTALLDSTDPVLLEYRPYHPTLRQDTNKALYDIFMADNQRLASILNSSQSTSLGLPKCHGVYDDGNSHPERPHIVYVLGLPFRPSGSDTPTLRDYLATISIPHPTDPSRGERRPLHSLSERFNFARRLAVTVLLIHASGWVHESINPQNILVLQREDTPAEKLFPASLGVPLLVGFHLSRPLIGDSAPADELAMENEASLYIHPRRLGSQAAKARFVRAYDVYSLGVVLLELGLWKGLFARLKGLNAVERRRKMVDMVPVVAATMGDAYAAIVEWCLEGDKEDLTTMAFVKEVLEKLENLASMV